jgi:hypothetical protein
MSEVVEPEEGAALKHWTVDKRVPLALILAISVQTCGIVWWASGLTSRVEQLERQAIASAPQADRLTRVEVKLESVRDGINEIKRLMQRPAGQ